MKEIKIGLNSWENDETLKAVFAIKTLKKLTIEDLPRTAYTEALLFSSNSIRIFELCRFCSHAFTELDLKAGRNDEIEMPQDLKLIMKNIIRTMPNLEYLSIIYIDKDIAEFLCLNLKNLKKIRSCFIAYKGICQRILSKIIKV